MTEKRVCLLDELLPFGPGVVSLTGGGGKTTLLFRLGRELAARGITALCTTTTRMCRPDTAGPLPFHPWDDPAEIVVPAGGALLAARGAPADGDAGKIFGYAAADIDALQARRVAEWILVEADGSARKPLKAPAEHEPVVPASTRAAIAVVGLSGVGRPLGPDTVFRPERFAAAAGLAMGDAVTPEAVAAIAVHPHGLFQHCPPGAARLLFCNQADLPGAREAGLAIARAVAARHPGKLRGVYVGALDADGLSCLALPAA